MSGLLKRRPRLQPEVRSNIRTFDEESGLVYSQISCKAGPMTADWVWKTKGSTREHGCFRSSGPGCSSLKNMAIRGVLLHSYSLTAEGLKALPWSIGQVLWQRILASQLDSLRVWQVFASAYPDELDASLKRKHYAMLEPTMGFNDYMTPLNSPAFQWLTFLTLSNITCLRNDLIALSRMANLGALTIGQGVLTPDVGLEDGVVRAWSNAAAEADAFSMLRVLNLREQKHITPRVFSYLHHFPSLALFNLEAYSISTKDREAALASGWKYKTGRMLNEHLSETGKFDKTWDSAVHACFRAAGAYGIERMTAEGVEAINSLPVLHFSLGAMPRDAGLNASGNYKLQCFERVKGWAPPVEGQKYSKPSISEVSHSSGGPRKKPVSRASKQQNARDFFLGLGG